MLTPSRIEDKMQHSGQGGVSSDASTQAGSLYASREKIYPRETDGLFTRLRVALNFFTLAAFFLLPYFSWNGTPLVLFDLPGRRFHLFGSVFTPHDLIYLTGFLIVAALALFLFTAVGGRLWCGYTCPQTVWTEIFVRVERALEGNRSKQMKLDRAPLSTEKVLKRGTKHALWLLIALATSFTFVGYFTPIGTLFVDLLTFNAHGWEVFFVAFFTGATYVNAGWMREQICTYACPYARFQSAMIDRSTLVVAFDAARGEPRGSRPRGTQAADVGLGDCINCQMCVQVCPTGIDIRDGLQYQCIGCAACIDICDSVMDKVGTPRGLVRYTTEDPHSRTWRSILRPRILIYTAIIVSLTIALVISFATRVPLHVDVVPDRASLYRETPNATVENVYTIRIANTSSEAHSFVLDAEGIPGVFVLMDRTVVKVESAETLSIPVRVRAPKKELQQQSTPVTIIVTATDEPTLAAQHVTRFLGPRTF